MRYSKWPFLAVLGLAMVWTGWLAYMASTVADPIVVSAPQLHLSSIVVVGKVTLEGANARVNVIRIYKDSLGQNRQKALPETLTIPWLPHYPKTFDLPFLLPLMVVQNIDGGTTFQVTPVFKQVDKKDIQVAVVYPLTESVRIQTERILGVK